MIRRREDLPGPASGLGIGAHYDPDAFGRFSEGIARFIGTARFLFVQTVLVVVWITLNVAAVNLRWDPYPFILLNLAFSTQAAYAAPSSCWPRPARTNATVRRPSKTEPSTPERRQTRSSSPVSSPQFASRWRMSSRPTTSRRQLNASRRPCNS